MINVIPEMRRVH